MATGRQKKNPLSDLVGYRKARAENQSDFWRRFGVTQSGGSRYESGRDVPRPTALLLMAYADGLITDQDLAKLAKKVDKV